MNLEGNPVSWRHNGEVDGGCGKHEAISGLEIYTWLLYWPIYFEATYVGPRNIFESNISPSKIFGSYII